MATLQIKQLPNELHAALRERARASGLTMSEYVTRVLRRDLARPSMAEWLSHTAGEPVRPPIDSAALLDDVRRAD